MGKGKGEGSESDPVQRRSQDVLQALASVRDHKSKSTMRPRRLVASCAQCCSGAWRGPVVRSTGSRRAVPLRLRAGVQLLLPFDWDFLVFPLTLAISTPGMHIALLGEGRLQGPPEPGLGGPVNDTVLPSFRPAADGQTGWWQARQTEPSLQPRCQLGPSACLMHDSVATASASARQENGPSSQLVTDGLGPEKVGSRSCCIGLSTGPVSAACGLAVTELEGSENGDRQAGRPTRRPLTTRHCARCRQMAGWLHHPLRPQLGHSVSLQVLQAIEEVTDRSIWPNLQRRKCPGVGKSGDTTGVWSRSYITFLLSVSSWLDPIYIIYMRSARSI